MKRVRFSRAEYAAFLAAQADRTKVEWLSVSGDLLTPDEHAELNALLSSFFHRKMPDRTGILQNKNAA